MCRWQFSPGSWLLHGHWTALHVAQGTAATTLVPSHTEPLCVSNSWSLVLVVHETLNTAGWGDPFLIVLRVYCCSTKESLPRRAAQRGSLRLGLPVHWGRCYPGGCSGTSSRWPSSQKHVGADLCASFLTAPPPSPPIKHFSSILSSDLLKMFKYIFFQIKLYFVKYNIQK